MTALPTTTETGWTVAYRPARGRFLRRLPLDLTETAAEATALRILAALGDDRTWEVHVVPNRQAELDGRVPEADHGTLIVRGGKGPRTLELREIDTPVALMLAVAQPVDLFLGDDEADSYRTPDQVRSDYGRDRVLTAAEQLDGEALAGHLLAHVYPSAFGVLAGQIAYGTETRSLQALLVGIDQGLKMVEWQEKLRLARKRAEADRRLRALTSYQTSGPGSRPGRCTTHR